MVVGIVYRRLYLETPGVSSGNHKGVASYYLHTKCFVGHCYYPPDHPNHVRGSSLPRATLTARRIFLVLLSSITIFATFFFFSQSSASSFAIFLGGGTFRPPLLSCKVLGAQEQTGSSCSEKHFRSKPQHCRIAVAESNVSIPDQHTAPT